MTIAPATLTAIISCVSVRRQAERREDEARSEIAEDRRLQEKANQIIRERQLRNLRNVKEQVHARRRSPIGVSGHQYRSLGRNAKPVQRVYTPAEIRRGRNIYRGTDGLFHSGMKQQ